MNENTSLVQTDEQNMLMDLSTAVTSYCSFDARTQEEKVMLFNCVNNPQKHLSEMINIPINLKHVYAETVEFVNSDTGEVSGKGVRMVFIDDNGVGYQASSKGIFSSTKKLFSIFGTPETWENPVKVVVKQISKSEKRKVLVFELA